MAYYLNSYRPLIWTLFGQQAAISHGLPRFIDASCRREPDFENPFPSMTAICRRGNGAVRLKEGDYVAYITVKRNYEPAAANGRYLIGGFKVIKRCTTHEEAAAWYTAENIPVPSNCFVAGNRPLDLHLTGGYSNKRDYVEKLAELSKEPDGVKSFNYAQEIYTWDNSYREIIEGNSRSKGNSIFIITELIKLELDTPPQLTTAVGERIFGDKFPNTRSLRRITDEQFWQLMSLLPTPTAKS